MTVNKLGKGSCSKCWRRYNINLCIAYWGQDVGRCNRCMTSQIKKEMVRRGIKI